ncbi:HEXXH motif-containing putative peptide modification protein [Streptomyces sp. M-16]|uniref:aKG-HExxH-type peptide beta-hydroxylase n=1 Tax=Streptomyces sp. M-16 TaxID=3233040 RepID=UPI003F9C3239
MTHHTEAAETETGTGTDARSRARTASRTPPNGTLPGDRTPTPEQAPAPERTPTSGRAQASDRAQAPERVVPREQTPARAPAGAQAPPRVPGRAQDPPGREPSRGQVPVQAGGHGRERGRVQGGLGGRAQAREQDQAREERRDQGMAPGTGGGGAGPGGELAHFTVSSHTLRALASTEPSAEGTRLVRDVRRSKRLLLLRAVLDAAPGAEAAERWALLEEAERQDPEAVRDVLHYPATGVWAEETLRRLHAPQGPPPDLAHLGALAVAAALRAGIGFKATLRPVGGRLALPTLGLLRPDRPGPLALTERSWDSCATLPLHALPGGRTALDDLDPYRAPSAAHPAPVRPARRLTPKGHKRWDTQWSGALTLLERYDSTRADEIGRLLRSVVPLAGGTRSSGATLPAAAGSVLARAQAPPALAATLVHEVQHGKLAALADILTLHTADRTPRFWAPWRSDPRPLEGLLHGAYAHLALAGYWQRAALYGARGAWAQHARVRAQVAAVLPVLRAQPQLTLTGREFVDGMAAAERTMDELPPPGDQHATARRALEGERRAWCEDHPELAAFVQV